nr:amidase family protein [Leucobacter chinensis]
MLQAHELSATELLSETKNRYERTNPAVNAVVSVDFDAAEQAAAASDMRRAEGLPARPLEGLPVVVKDLEETAGLRTTYGSLRYATAVPDYDTLLVQRLREAGAVIYGKSNTPEFGTGSHTYNRVFGTTTNPFNTTRSAGGSSGGAAAALAMGLSSVADGSDMGGSLRNPAAFCNVVGLRPSIGRVPNWPSANGWETLSTNGPMARTVDDAALLLSVIAGADPRTPLAFPDQMGSQVQPVAQPLRIGWSRTLGGLDIQPEITKVLDRDGLETLRELGHTVRDVEPDMRGADEAFRTLRGLNYAHTFASMVRDHRQDLGSELIANTEAGLSLTSRDLFAAREQRTRVYDRMAELFETIDVLAAPVTSVLPFDIQETWPREINGVQQRDYLEWMRASWRISLTGYVAISVPCGFSSDGLPVGLHLIAPPRSEGLILSIAKQFEQARPLWLTEPPAFSLHPSYPTP